MTRDGYTRTTRRLFQRSCAAYHEAGHAFMKLMVFGRTGTVTINADGLGYTAGTGLSAGPLDTAMIAMAGWAAECVANEMDATCPDYDVDIDDPFVQEECGDEFTVARVLPNREAQIMYYQFTVEALVDGWDVVDALAQELIQKGRVTPRRARSIFATHLKLAAA